MAIQTERLTEKLIIKELATSGNTAGISRNFFKVTNIIFGTLLNQRSNLGFDSDYQGDVYTDSPSFYCRFIDLPKKNTRIEWESKEYEIVNITHAGVRRRDATIIELRGAT